VLFITYYYNTDVDNIWKNNYAHLASLFLRHLGGEDIFRKMS